MSDTKPYLTAADVREAEVDGVMSLNAGLRVRATVEALEAVTRERDELVRWWDDGGAPIDQMRRAERERDEALRLYRATMEHADFMRAQMAPCDVHHGARRACGQCFDSLLTHLKEARRERDELRSKTYCAYCGLAFLLDDEAATQVSEHVAVCEKHPMRQVERERDEARAREAWMARERFEWEGMFNKERAKVARLREALVECSHGTTLADPEPCWCPHPPRSGEEHGDGCLAARAALKEMEP